MKYMYKRIPSRVVIAAFPDAKAAKVAAEDLAVGLSHRDNNLDDDDNNNPKHTASSSMLCTSLAVLSKSQAGKITIKEHGKNGPVNGFVEGGLVGGAIGGVTGGLIASILGPIGTAAVGTAGGFIGATVGAATGTVAGTIQGLTIQSSMNNLKVFAQESLEPGSSMMIALFGEVVVKSAGHWSSYYSGTETIRAMATMSINEALQRNKNFSLGFSVGDGGICAPRTTLSNETCRVKALENLLELVEDHDLENENDSDHQRSQPESNKGGRRRPVLLSGTKLLLLNGLAKGGRPTATTSRVGLRNGDGQIV